MEAAAPLLEAAQRLLQGRRVVAADRHRLADALHGRRERRIGRGELLEREARHLHDHVVEGRLEARGRRSPGDLVADLVEAVADRESRGDLRDREPGRLRRERARARHARVHLDDDDAAVGGVHRELDVAAARVDTDRADDVDADVAQALILAVRQGQCRCDRDRVAGVHADRVDVLDRAHHDGVVGGVAHELELVLLPAGDRLLEQHLARRALVQAVGDHADELVAIVREAGSQPSHRERGTHHQGVSEVICGIHGLADGVSDMTARDLGARRDHQLLELEAVLALLDRLDLGPDELDAVLREHSGLVECDRRVQRRLAAQRGQHGIRHLLLDDLGEHLGRDRLDVGGVGEVGVGHDRRRVRVDQDDAHALGAQHTAGLRARVVELGGLADHDRPGADDEHALDVGALGHRCRPRRRADSTRPSGSSTRSAGANGPTRRTCRTGSWRRAAPRRPRGGTAPRTPGCRAPAAPRPRCR